MNDPKLLIVVTSQHGEKFIGYVECPITQSDPRRYLEERVEKNLPITMSNVRLFVCQVTPQVSRESGQILGVKTFAALLPVDVFSGPVECIHVRPSSWYFVDEVPSLKKKMQQLMEAAEKNEKVNQAREAGLHIPGDS